MPKIVPIVVLLYVAAMIAVSAATPIKSCYLTVAPSGHSMVEVCR